MNVVLVLVVVVGSCVCGVLPQPTPTTHYPQVTQGNRTQHVVINDKEIKFQPDVVTPETAVKKNTRMHGDKSENVKANNHIRRDSRVSQRLQYILKETEAKILEMNKRHPNRGKLKTLLGLERLKQEEMSWINATSSPHTEDCVFVCPDAESLAPCTCDPCTHNINCSFIASFEQLYNIFHSTDFPNPRFNQFLLVGSFRTDHRATSATSGTFLAQTFGNISFTSIWVEEVSQLTVVESGAFDGSEETLKKINFRWNSALTSFPFEEIAKMTELDLLEVRFSNLTAVPTLPHNMRLTRLYLLDNPLMTTMPRMAFAQLPNLLILDLGFNSFKIIEEDSLYFSSQNVLVFLDHNFINTIHDNAFSRFQPVGLDVSSNNLIELEQQVFQPILDHIIAQQYDSYIDASDNPLQCGAQEWLTQNPSYLSHIFLSDSPCMKLT